MPLHPTLKTLDFEYVEQINQSAYLTGEGQYAANSSSDLVGSRVFWLVRAEGEDLKFSTIGCFMSCENEEGCMYGFTSGHTFKTFKNELEEQKHKIPHPLFSQLKGSGSQEQTAKFKLAEDFFVALTQMEINGSQQTIDVAIFKLCDNLHNNMKYDLEIPRAVNAPKIFHADDEDLKGRQVCKKGLWLLYII